MVSLVELIHALLYGSRAEGALSLRLCPHLVDQRHRVRTVVLGARPRGPAKRQQPMRATRFSLSADVHTGLVPGLGAGISRLPLHVIHEWTAFSPTDTMPLTVWASR